MSPISTYIIITAIIVAIASFWMTKKGADFDDLTAMGITVLFWPIYLVIAVVISPIWIPYLIAKYL